MELRKTIVVISEHPAEGWGGPVQYICILLPFLKKLGFHIVFLADGGFSKKLDGVLRETNADVVNPSKGLLRFRRALKPLPRILRYPIESLLVAGWLRGRSARPDKVLVSLTSPGRYLWPYGLLGEGVFVFHSEPTGPNHKKAGVLFRRLIGRDATLIGVSSWVVESIRNVWGVDLDSRRLHTIPNPSPSSEIAPLYDPASRNIVLMVGAANEYKNPWFWLAVAERVIENQDQSDLVFRWIGDGPDLLAMRSWVINKGLESRIELPGFIENTDQEYAKAKIYFHASIRENSSFACIDALRHRLPLFVSPIGGLREFVEEGENGQFIILESVERTAENLLAIWRDEDYLRLMSVGSATIFGSDHSNATWENRMATVF